MAKYGKVDILVSNAGIQIVHPLLDFPFADWTKLLAIHLDGAFLTIIDLFVGKRALPSNMMEVLARRDEIVYSERIRSDLRYREMINSYRRLVDSILGRLEPDDIAKIKQRPGYIQLMGNGAPSSTARAPSSRGRTSRADYDFSESAIQGYQAEGYTVARAAPGRT